MIDRLEILVALAREKHFGRAAHSLGITQPTLSSALRALESQLGVQLVKRGARFEGLTPEGERALDWARRIVAEGRAFRADMRALREGITGELRLGVIPTATARVAALTARFLAANPRARLAIISLSSDGIIHGIEALELDAGLIYLDIVPGRLRRLPLYAERYRLVRRGGPEGPADWAEAARLPLALLSRDMRNRAIVERRLLAAGAGEVTPRIESNSTLAILGCVAQGPWAAILPAGLLEALPLPEGVTVSDLPGEGEQVGLITLDRDPPAPILGAFLSSIR